MAGVLITTDKQSKHPLSYDEAIRELNRLKKQGYFGPQTFPVETPVAYYGKIIFADGYQEMYTTGNGRLVVNHTENKFNDCSDDFVWIKCKRGGLKAGDVAYRAGRNHPGPYKNRACCIVNKLKYRFINGDNDIITSDTSFPHWFKLVRKDSL